MNLPKVDEVVLKFKIDDEYIPNPESDYAKHSDEFKVIKRYNVFKYFEDINMLLPIETKFDEANNTLYIEVDELGTYCVMDMEKLLEGLGIDAYEEAEIPVPQTQNAPKAATNTSWTMKADDAFNVVFAIDIRNCISEEDFQAIKDNIIEASKGILGGSKNAKIYLIRQYGYNLGKGYDVITYNGEESFSDIKDIEQALEIKNINVRIIVSCVNMDLGDFLKIGSTISKIVYSASNLKGGLI